MALLALLALLWRRGARALDAAFGVVALDGDDVVWPDYMGAYVYDDEG